MAYLGEEIKKLGFGLMRLPKKEEKIDVEQVKTMVDRFMEEGFTYFDTAWAYAGSEDAIREALVERYPRESYQLATKLAAWIKCKTKEEAEAQFATSLKQTGAGYFDFYLLHNVGDFRKKVFDDYDIWNFVAEKKKEGLVRHIGFSFHDKADKLEEILQEHPEMEFVQLQINYADWEDPAIQSRACYETARKYGKPVIIMEPVKGGMLAAPPPSVEKVLKDAEPESSAASWALRFAADLEGVITVLSGMSSIAQMEDNLSSIKDFHGLSAAQRETIEKAQEEMAKIPLIPCTSCDYCAKVCPMDIGISGSFNALNAYTLFSDLEYAYGRLKWLVDVHSRKRAEECVKCGSCEDVCPQHISIRENLEKVVETFKNC